MADGLFFGEAEKDQEALILSALCNIVLLGLWIHERWALKAAISLNEDILATNAGLLENNAGLLESNKELLNSNSILLLANDNLRRQWPIPGPTLSPPAKDKKE